MPVFTMRNKDKGKGIQMNNYYKIVPTKNSFKSLANCPPQPYKTFFTTPPTKPSRDNYFLRYTEHLFLRATKFPLQMSSSNDLVQQSFADSHHLSDHPQILDNFMNLFLQTPSQLTLPIPRLAQLPPTFYIQNALSRMFWTSRNGKIPYTKDNSLFLLNQLLTITWIIKGLGLEHFSQTRDSFWVL